MEHASAFPTGPARSRGAAYAILIVAEMAVLDPHPISGTGLFCEIFLWMLDIKGVVFKEFAILAIF
jgi:hypothetical protein